MKMSRKWILVAALVLSVAMASSGTIAYLQDSDSDVNVMTMGSVHIKQHEYERVVNADGSYATDTIDGKTSYVLKEFTQGKPIVPSAVVTNADGWDWDPITVRMSQVDSYGGMQTFLKSSNAQDKFVTVENTGKSPAFVRTLVAIEIGDASADLIGVGYHSTWTKNSIGTIEIDGNKYALTEYLYAGGELSDGTWRHEKGILPAGDTTYPNLSQVYLHAKATNEDLEAIDGNDSGMLDILVVSQAVQADGFADAKTALDTAFGEVSATSHPWMDGEEGDQVPDGMKGSTSVESVDELAAALNNGYTNIYLADGEYTMPPAAKGKTFSLYGTKDAVMKINASGYENCNYNLENSDVTFNGITIAGNGGYARSTTTFKNCTITGAFEMQYNPVLFDNCTFNLTNSYIWTLSVEEATFNNCVFNTDGKALLVYSHGATESVVNINNCVFNASAAKKTGTGLHVAAVSIDATNAKSLTVNFTGTNIAETGENAFASLYQIKGGESKVVVNGL